ncbi:MAG: riboflavin biosynthesis protein RibF [Deltaproteobacteria bacterium]|nr:riboflavin biosynthesis protein RibF [Deltaproteobacteria bacterium]
MPYFAGDGGLAVRIADLREIVPLLGGGSVVSWGNFDGVHLGHQALLSRLAGAGASLGLPSVALTFDPHPDAFFSRNAPRPLADPGDKLALISRLGVDYALVLPFDAAFARQSPRDFARDILVASLRAKAVILGYDLGFGRSREGGFNLLRGLGLEYGFSVEQTSAVRIEAKAREGTPSARALPVSSTRIREAVGRGDFEEAAAMLGRVYSVRGPVRWGARRGGSLLGFPTANLDPGPLLLPPHGVYACLAACGGLFYPAAANLGLNPSFETGSGADSAGPSPSLEAYMLDFEGDIYGRELRLYFLRFLRPERRFADAAALREQIGLDVSETRALAEAALAADNFSTLFPL